MEFGTTEAVVGTVVGIGMALFELGSSFVLLGLSRRVTSVGGTDRIPAFRSRIVAEFLVTVALVVGGGLGDPLQTERCAFLVPPSPTPETDHRPPRDQQHESDADRDEQERDGEVSGENRRRTESLPDQYGDDPRTAADQCGSERRLTG